MDLATIIPICLKASIALAVLGLGLRATVGEATSLLRAPSQLGRAAAAMLIVVPVFAMFVARALELQPAVAIALVALALSPVPPIWPGKALRAGGQQTYTIGLLVAVTVLSIVVAPAVLGVRARALSLPVRPAAAAVAAVALTTVLLPLFAGIGIRRLAPRAAAAAAGPISTFAMVLLVLSALPVVIQLWPVMTSLLGDGTLLAMVAVALVALAAGHVLGGPSDEDRTVLALACASRHPGIAVTIAALAAPVERLALPAVVLYLLVSSVVGALYVAWRKRRRHEVPQRGLVSAPARAR